MLEETASLVDFIKATVKFVYCEKWNSTDVMTAALCMQAVGLALQRSGYPSTQYVPYPGHSTPCTLTIAKSNIMD